MSGLSPAPFDPDTACLGHGQTLTDVSGSRSCGTSYQNTTGRPIAVLIDVQTWQTATEFQISEDGITWIGVSNIDNGDTINRRTEGTYIIPDGFYYRVASSSAAVQYWSELS